MFIAIAHDDHSSLLDNCDPANEDWRDFSTETDNPIFVASSFEDICASIVRYYKSLNDDECPGYTVYSLGESWWIVNGSRTVTIDIEHHDA